VKVRLFYHSLVSDWNHGNAHFLRGIASELIRSGADVRVYEPRDAWSAENLMHEAGVAALEGYRNVYPGLESIRHDGSLDLERELDGADLVLVHEWNDPELVARIGEIHRRRPTFTLLFHDTHHRSATAPEEMARYDLSAYDGVLAFGEVVAARYRTHGWACRAWVWHEAADTEVFRPIAGPKAGDLVWIGNWGDGERTLELEEFLIRPVRELGLQAKVYGVRYPDHAIAALADAGIEYGGWLPNYRAPEVFAQYRMTVHVPRGPYTRDLPGVPTIRMFEAMACGIPLLSAPWSDCERLFRNEDYQRVADGQQMKDAMRSILDNPAAARDRARSGLETIAARHTCRHRVAELLRVHAAVGRDQAVAL
jgi:spore maturation protein CgeB